MQAEELNKLKALAETATPIGSDLYGDRHFQGPYSQANLTKEQDDFVTAITPVTVLSLIAEIERLQHSDSEWLEKYSDSERRLSSATQERDAAVAAARDYERAEVEYLKKELQAVKAQVPSDHCVVPRSLVVDVMGYGEDGKVLEAWMVDKLESALLGAFPEAKQPAPAEKEKPL